MLHLVYVPGVFAAGVFLHAVVSNFLRAKSAKALTFAKKETGGVEGFFMKETGAVEGFFKKKL